MKVLVTGGAGFIGSNFIRLTLRETSHKIINLDALTYAGNLENLKEVENNKRYQFVKGDIRDQKLVESIFTGGVDAVVNFAAESHVDRSILDPASFLQTNYMGTAALLDACRRIPVKVFLQISTDEVYGPLLKGLADEEYDLKPSSPYSASKAGADLLCKSYQTTFGIPVTFARMSNNYGPYQFPEKLIPLFISNALEDKPLPVYGDGLYVRDWIFVEDACSALLLILEEGKVGEVYNVGGGNQRTNLEVTRIILKELKTNKRLVKHVADRPGHDRRYALNSAKIRRELGFEPSVNFEHGLRMTVKWYLDNQDWWQRVKSGVYQQYYEKQYGKRLKKK
jgi:dTDP-glucose 4,6-dehydratase